jgi:hypothetical protein
VCYRITVALCVTLAVLTLSAHRSNSTMQATFEFAVGGHFSLDGCNDELTAPTGRMLAI